LITRGDFGLYILPEYFAHTEHRGKPEAEEQKATLLKWAAGLKADWRIHPAQDER
jgi:hypothetical protein